MVLHHHGRDADSLHRGLSAETAVYFLVTPLIVPGILTFFTAIWFGIGGARDLRRMFRDLEKRNSNPLDDGRVEGNVSPADKAQVDASEQKMPAEAVPDRRGD